ncbi:hypothetical protein OESDEN_14815 [Oesophagostomum dentatum]|uniref:Receptor L-domain domain-containing protein n=1 Tax=Oesophagostomum dentatum TaxID=61180 RepID=A0A0B1SPL2_OESDE|nr:hypothetical protein OESDEN_14815 [Oesophagostomum dentatum]
MGQNFPAVKITFNHYLEYLGLKKLTKISTRVPAEISNNRILEFTFEEVEMFTALLQAKNRIEGAFPSENLPAGVCVFNSDKNDIAAIPENCTTLLGLLYYERHLFTDLEVRKLQQIRKIYGNINFSEMPIENLSIFSNVEKIISLNASVPAVQFYGLDKLTSIELPKLQNLYSYSDMRFSIVSCTSINITNETCSFFERANHQASRY